MVLAGHNGYTARPESLARGLPLATSDTVVGIIGAVILTGAMVAVFYYENQAGTDAPGASIGTGAETFTFVYEEATTRAIDAETQAELAVGATRTHTFQVPAYAYNVSATIEWTDGDQPIGGLGQTASGPDEFKITLISPSGVRYDPQEGTSPLTSFHFHATEVDVTPPQTTVVVRGDDAAAAETQLAESTADAHGVGTWTVEVNMTNVNDNTGRPVGADAGNDYTLTVVYEHWKPVLQTAATGADA